MLASSCESAREMEGCATLLAWAAFVIVPFAETATKYSSCRIEKGIGIGYG